PAKTQKAVEEYLARLKAPNPQIKPVTDDAVTNSLPGGAYFAVIFRQYPVAIVPPEPLKSGNVLAVKGDKVELISDATALEKFFKAHLKPVKDETGVKEAAYAWLRLSQELHQDGFFRFSIPDKELTADGAKKATGKALVDPKGGDKGEIAVTLTFADGK